MCITKTIIYVHTIIYVQQELKEEDPEKFKKKYSQLEDKHAKFRRQLEKRRVKNGTNLKQLITAFKMKQS